MNDVPRAIVDEREVLSCIHCGFCLPTCPTYAVTGNEAESPRGRIYFMRALLEGRIEPTETVRGHLDHCLACFACETACPSGVPYRRLIEDARTWTESVAPRRFPWGWRTFFRRVLPYANRLRLALLPMWLAQRVGLRPAVEAVAARVPLAWLGRGVGLLPPRIPPPLLAAMPAVMPAIGRRKRRVGFMLGCVMEGMVPHLNRLMIRLLRELGCEVVVPRDQGCCGALARYEGDRSFSEDLRSRLLDTFARADVSVLVASAAGCGSSLKSGPAGMAGGVVEVRDFTEVAAELAADQPPRFDVPLAAAYQEACHLGHAQRVREAPRALLRAVPGVRLVELPEQELCCGSAGVYNVLEPGTAAVLAGRKVDHATALGVDAVITANPGCYIQLHNGLKGRAGAPGVRHLVEVLAEGYGIAEGP